MGDLDVIPVQPVMAHQQPSGEPRLDGVFGIGKGRARGLNVHGLCVAQKATVQGWTLVHHLLQVMGRHSQPLTSMLHEELERGRADAERDGHTDHTLSPDDADLDLAAIAIGANRRVTHLHEVDMLNRLVRLDQHTAQFKLDRLQMGLKRGKVLGRKGSEQLIADG